MSKLLNIEVANTNVQAVATSSPVNLGTVIRKHCCNDGTSPTFTYDNNSTSIRLNQHGYYLVIYHSSFNGAVGNATLSLYANGSLVPNAIIDETIGTADTEIHTSSFSTIIRVFNNSPVLLQVVNGLTTVNVINSDIKIIKIC